ncbi:hypothetical protein C8J57DRAFT_1400015 [Mycena rebaudengoi]|nr:hypothetical protein C8J57DRAFT_1400015 [Mycena rebaudengoi]
MSPTETSSLPTADLNDPPPPYPSSWKANKASESAQISSTDSHSDYETLSPQQASAQEGAEGEPTETTPFLAPRRVFNRPRSGSQPSVFSSTSVAPSLAQTIASIFRDDDDEEEVESGTDGGPEDGLLFSAGEVPDEHTRPERFWSRRAWRRYFRPVTRKAYYKSLLHLYVINFPYALAAFLFTVVFTVTGTTLLMALPLGALLCFFNLIGVRALARGELALQTKYHGPLAYPPPHPPRPIFTRMREPGVPETSFYANTRAMFTDPTSYQALFYFIVIKPSITLIFSIGLLVLGLPAFVLVAPAPAAMRAIRKLGIWQANVAMEGLYLVLR